MPAAEHRKHKHSLNKSGIASWVWVLLCAVTIWGCAPQPTPGGEQQSAAFLTEHSKGAFDALAAGSAKDAAAPDKLPVRYQTPSYSVKSLAGAGGNAKSDLATPVGARIVPPGPKPLRLVMQELAKLKSMNISWANDVDKEALVNVTIMPEEDFFEAIDNVLRQLDYFHDMEGNTIVVKHKETKKFHVAMPFMSSTYVTGVGGDVLGSTEGSNMSGNLTLKSAENKFDIWTNIETNLNKILEIDTVQTESAQSKGNVKGSAEGKAEGDAAAAKAGNKAQGSANVAVEGKAEGQMASASTTVKTKGRGFYTVDRPIGLITVTAPRSYQKKVDDYLASLKGEIYRQVSIEAKIIEVTLSSDNTTGLDWSALSSKVGFKLDLSNASLSMGGTLNTEQDQIMMSLDPANFGVLIDAIKEQGHVEVLSNPKISVMNGQPAMISVGENVTYVKSVTSETDATSGNVSYTITPDSVMSGLGMGVIANIMEDDQIILNLTPVTSSLTQPIEYRTMGSNSVGLPKINLREMTTMVRVKNGEMLVVGGLTDTTAAYENTHVAGLGQAPGFFGKLFRADGTVSSKKELIILLRPQIIQF